MLSLTIELFVLLKNDTRVLVPARNQYTVGWKSGFKLKHSANGPIEHQEAYLIVKDFHQQADVDFDDCSIIKLTIVRTIFSLKLFAGRPKCVSLMRRMHFFLVF